MPLNIDTSKLILAPFLQDNVIDPETREPAIGQVFYYKAGCDDCPKNIYIETGDPQDPFEAAPNPIPLDAAGSIPYYTWAFPFNEDDDSIVELYDVVVKRFDDTEILRRDNWPPNAGGATPVPPITESSGTLNLCPNYEFHSMVDEDIYSIEPVRTDGQVMSWGWRWFLEDSGKYDLLYQSQLLNQGTPTDVEQTPLSEAVIRITNTQGTSGYRQLGFYLGTYNAFQGKFVALSHYLRNINATPSLDVFLVRENPTGTGGIDTPVNLGTLTIPSNNLTKVELTVQIPDITETGYLATDRVYIALSPPENVDCSFGITANWYQVVDSATATGIPSRLPMGLSRANAFFGESDLNSASSQEIQGVFTNADFQPEDGLSLTVTDGHRNSLVRTGIIEQVLSSSVHQVNGAIEISTSSDNMLYVDEKPRDTGELLPKAARSNRLIYELYHSSSNNRHSFQAIKKSADTAEVSLLIGVFKTDWTTNNPSAITLTNKSSSTPYEVVASKQSPTVMRLQYSYIWIPPNGFTESYPTGLLIPQNGFPIVPVQNIANWFSKDFTGGSFLAPAYGTEVITSSSVPAGGGLGLGVDLTFLNSDPISYAAKHSQYTYSPVSGVSTTIFRYHDFIEIPANTSPSLRAKPYGSYGGRIDPNTPNSGSVHLIWKNGGSTPSSQYMKGQKSTAIIDISTGVANVEALIDKTVAFLNGNEAFDIKYNTLPNHGDWVKFSNDQDDFAIQFIEEGQGVPTLPTNVVRTFPIRFTSGQAIEPLVDATVAAFPLLMRAIPSIAELGLTPTQETTYMINL